MQTSAVCYEIGTTLFTGGHRNDQMARSLR